MINMAKSNRKNQKGKAFLKNFTEDYVNRMILADSELVNKKSIIDNNTMRDKLKKITEDVNYTIQNLNLKVCRNIPYLSLRFSIEFCDEVRMYMRNAPETFDLRLQIDDAMNTFVNISHFLDLYIVAGGKEMYISEINNVNGKIVADYDYKEIAITDIFLDIAMFNSYSFLKHMPAPDKKRFSKMKADYYLKNKLDSFFNNEDNEELEYYSFAFACHSADDTGNISFDIDKYIDIWDGFIKENYATSKHVEYSLDKQIEMRVDDHIPHDYYTRFSSYKPGVYFIFRVNQKDIPIKRKASVNKMFKTDNAEIGDLCIVDLKTAINYFETFNELFTDLFIAAFKIVIQ